MGLITLDHVVILTRQQEGPRIEEIIRDPKGNLIKFYVCCGNSQPQQNEAQAYLYASGRWEPLYSIFVGLLPQKPEMALMQLQTAVGSIMEWGAV